MQCKGSAVVCCGHLRGGSHDEAGQAVAHVHRGRVGGCACACGVHKMRGQPQTVVSIVSADHGGYTTMCMPRQPAAILEQCRAAALPSGLIGHVCNGLAMGF